MGQKRRIGLVLVYNGDASHEHIETVLVYDLFIFGGVEFCYYWFFLTNMSFPNMRRRTWVQENQGSIWHRLGYRFWLSRRRRGAWSFIYMGGSFAR